MTPIVLVSRACPVCSGPQPCDCWKANLTPDERDAAQLGVATAYLGMLAVRAERKTFMRKHPEMTRSRAGKVGTLHNIRGTAKYAGLRFGGQR